MAARKCVRCGRDPDRGPIRIARDPPRCPRCFFRRLARRHTGSPGLWAALRALWVKQGGRCAYTNEPLTLGTDATLDHRQPKSRGGRNKPDNLQWVSARVNEVKRDLTHSEFVTLCRKVADCSRRPPAK